MKPPRQTPSIWIELSLESAPRLRMDVMSEGEFNRLADWINSQPDLQDLYVRAVESERRRLEGKDE